MGRSEEYLEKRRGANDGLRLGSTLALAAAKVVD
jgi:hypothetical protein